MIFPLYNPDKFDYQSRRPVWEQDFGVYKQQTARTTRHKKNFYISYSIIDKNEADIIEQFLTQNRGKEFTLENPLDGISYNVRLQGELPRFSWIGPVHRRIQEFILEEV